MKIIKNLTIFALALVLCISLAACTQNNQAQEQDSLENQEIITEAGDTEMADTVNVLITMEDGKEIKLELYPDIAPITVENFVNLAQEGFYDGLTFHRIISGFMIQGGDPEGTGMGGPGYAIKGEFEANGVKNDIAHERGVISMARARSYDSAGSQFFIMHEDAPHLDGQYAAFGRVIEGMDVVDDIASVEVGYDGQTPLVAPVIKTITVLSK